MNKHNLPFLRARLLPDARSASSLVSATVLLRPASIASRRSSSGGRWACSSPWWPPFCARMPALSQSGSAQGKACCRRHHWSGWAMPRGESVGRRGRVIAYQARAAVRQKRARPDDAPRRARVPEGEAPAGAELATGAVPPLTAAGTADAARPAPPTPPTPPTRATLAIAPPVNPGCPTRLPVTGELVAAMVPPGPRGDGGPRERHACNRIARSPGMFCRFIHDGAMKWRSPDTTGDVAKRVAPPLRAKMYRMCRRPLASFSKCTEGV